MISQIELRAKLSKIVWNQYRNPFKKLIATLMFNFRSWLFDLFYKSFDYEELGKAIQIFRDYIESHNLHYEFDYFDCDDFALLFKALTSAKLNSNAVGIALGLVCKDNELLGGHAWNIVLLNNELWYFEPQTLELFFGNLSSDGFKYELLAVLW